MTHAICTFLDIFSLTVHNRLTVLKALPTMRLGIDQHAIFGYNQIVDIHFNQQVELLDFLVQTACSKEYLLKPRQVKLQSNFVPSSWSLALIYSASLSLQIFSSLPFFLVAKKLFPVHFFYRIGTLECDCLTSCSADLRNNLAWQCNIAYLMKFPVSISSQMQFPENEVLILWMYHGQFRFSFHVELETSLYSVLQNNLFILFFVETSQFVWRMSKI